MQLQKVAALLLVILGAVLLFKTLAATWFLLLVIAAAFAIGSATGMIGKWGYAAAAVCAVIAVPGFVLGFMFKGLSIGFRLVKMAPWLLVIVGIYMLFKSK